MKTILKNKYFQALIVVGLYLGFFIFIINAVSDVLDFTVIFERKGFLAQAMLQTIYLSILSLITSMIIGFVLFLMIESKYYFFRIFAKIFREIIMGTSLLVLVFVVVYIIGVTFQINEKLMLGFLAITLYMSPYMTNAYDGAYKTIDKNQFIIMDLYGFNVYQKYRYFIIPQMIKPIMPALINNLSAIIKGTSILSTIAVTEIFYAVSLVSNQTYRYIEGYFVLWIVYLIITIPLSLTAQYLTRRWNNEN
jgi:His/Glu/Gln/Arg/opine family amino acid ABC transporter permease subunit